MNKKTLLALAGFLCLGSIAVTGCSQSQSGSTLSAEDKAKWGHYGDPPPADLDKKIAALKSKSGNQGAPQTPPAGQ